MDAETYSDWNATLDRQRHEITAYQIAKDNSHLRSICRYVHGDMYSDVQSESACIQLQDCNPEVWQVY